MGQNDHSVGLVSSPRKPHVRGAVVHGQEASFVLDRLQ